MNEKRDAMKTDLLNKIFGAEQGVRRDGDGYLIGDELELSVLLDMGHEALQVAKVRRVTIQSDLLVLETHKGERVYAAAQGGVRALKFSPSDGGKSRGTGFTALR